MSSVTSLLAAICCTLLTLTAVAQTDAKKADPTGTWTWSTPGRDGGTPRESKLKLKVEGDKVMGTLTTPGRQGGDPRETQIEEGKIKGDEISFTVTREFQGNKMVSKYNGKVSADAIKGKIEFEGRNGTQTRDWDAKRAPAEKTEKK